MGVKIIGWWWGAGGALLDSLRSRRWNPGMEALSCLFYVLLNRGRFMAKGSSDLILRDRLQFTLDASGNQTTVYGRFDLSEFVSTLDRKGLSIKEIQFMIRDDQAGNTGNFLEVGRVLANASNTLAQFSNFKLYATTRAYENAADVGIASPDVLCVETWQSIQGPNITTEVGGAPIVGSGSSFLEILHNKYGTPDLHPDGFPVVTDLLIGVAADSWESSFGKTLELDVMLIASPVTINQKQLTEMLVQGQDQ